MPLNPPSSNCGCPITSSRETCFNCRNCLRTHCQCSSCTSCGNRNYAEDTCSSCHRCSNGCCNCVTCATTNCNVRAAYGGTMATDRTICGNCGNCVTHCRCYRCNVCEVRLPRNERNASTWCSLCNRCVAHCEHYVCRTCHAAGNINSQCGNCGNCHSHCSCVECTQCSRRYSSRSNIHMPSDGSCGVCGECCRCNTTGVPFRNGKFQFHSSVFSKGEFKLNPLRRHISVEMEVDRYSTGKPAKKVNQSIDRWHDPVVRDGSLGSSGFEITTNPTNGDKFLNHMKEIATGLTEIDGKCSDSCGLHVHINCKGDILLDKKGNPVLDKNGKPEFDKNTAYNQYDLQRLVVLYDKVEQALFGLCKDNRLTSRYSAICGKYWVSKASNHKDLRKNLLTTMYFEGAPNTLDAKTSKKDIVRKYGSYKALGDTIKQQKSHKYNQIRYKALNVHSYFMRGTIEFRHHEGTTDYNEVVNWSLICATVVDRASKMTSRQIEALPSDSYEALLAILPDNLQSYCKQKWSYFEANTWHRLKMVMADKFQSASPSVPVAAPPASPRIPIPSDPPMWQPPARPVPRNSSLEQLARERAVEGLANMSVSPVSGHRINNLSGLRMPNSPSYDRSVYINSEGIRGRNNSISGAFIPDTQANF